MRPSKPRLRLWVAALRSGEFVRGVGALRTEVGVATKYCPLGVACVVYQRRTGGRVNWQRGCLPEPVARWYGLPNGDPVVRGRDVISRSDALGEPFERLADEISREFNL
jgi:hypothetical protein